MSRQLTRLAAPVLIAMAGGAFWLLTHGGASSAVQVTGFAEAVDHPIAPVGGGRLTTVNVVLGQAVKAGDVLCTLDTRELELKRDTAKADLVAAQAQLDASEISRRAAVVRAELLVLRLRTQQTKGRAELAQLEQQLTRLDKLANQQLVPATEIEARKLKQAGLTATVGLLNEAARKKLAGLGTPSGKATAKSSTNAQVSLLMQPYREAVHLKELALKATELALEQAVVRAPVDGVISAVLHYPGDVVSAGTEVVRVTNGRPGRVVCWVPERLAQRASQGATAEVRGIALFASRIKATVAEASPGIEEVPLRSRPSPGVPAWGRRVVLDCGPDSKFLLGEALHVRF